MNKQNLNHISLNTGGFITNQHRTGQEVKVPQKATGDVKPEPKKEESQIETEDKSGISGAAKASPNFKKFEPKTELTPEDQKKSIAENTVE